MILLYFHHFLFYLLFRLYLWEILHLTIHKMNKHVSRLSRELAEARERLRHAESDSDDSEDDGEGNNNSGRGKSGGDDREKPSEDMVDRMEERLEGAQAQQKNLFLIIFQVKLTFCSNNLKKESYHDDGYKIGERKTYQNDQCRGI